jgi:predicted dehydrogenase
VADRIRIGIIGANLEKGWAAKSHLPALQALPDFEIVAVATTRQESAEEAARAYSAHFAFSDAYELIEHPQVDVVTVSVKAQQHHDLVEAAVKARKHVYCEWPLGRNLAEAERLCGLADAASVCHMIGLQVYQSPLLKYLRDLVNEEGYVGRVLACQMLTPGGPAGDDVPAERTLTLDRAAGSNSLTVRTGHSLASLRYCLGEIQELGAFVTTQFPKVRVTETKATIAATAPDNITVNGTLASGAIFAVNVTSGAPCLHDFSFQIHGTKGSLLVDGEGSIHRTDGWMTLRGAKGNEPMSLIDIPARYTVTSGLDLSGAAVNVAGQYVAMARAIRGHRGVQPSFNDAVTLHRLLNLVELSSTAGTTQPVF